MVISGESSFSPNWKVKGVSSSSPCSSCVAAPVVSWDRACSGAVEGGTVLFLFVPEEEGCTVGKENASAALVAPAVPVFPVKLLQPDRTVVVQTLAS